MIWQAFGRWGALAASAAGSAGTAFSGGALVCRSAAFSYGLVGYENETYDTDGWHDNVTNNSRLTVPSGVTLVRTSHNTKDTGVPTLQTQKNGADVMGGVLTNVQDSRSCGTSALLAVSPGDYITNNADGDTVATQMVWSSTQMVTMDRDLTVEAAADFVADARRSRYPVCSESLDDVVGVVHAKDILTAVRREPGALVGAILRPPVFVPGTREVEDVLADMKRLKVHLAMVLDEYGGTAGLVTMEDLLEEIVGDIFDEYDRAERAKPVPEDAYLLDGGLSISDFNAAHELQLDDTDYTTVGGYVFGQIGRLPRPGDRVIAGRDQFEVVEMEGRRVKSVRYILGSAGPAA